MPRLPNSLLSKAGSIDPLVLLILPACRDLNSAKNELRWLREHVQGLVRIKKHTQPFIDERTSLRQLCERRRRGEPLQYILGSEFFGDLEIQCRPGVLIPRQETAASVTRLAQILRDETRQRSRERFKHGYVPGPLQVLDLCCGSGCMSLLLIHHLLEYGVLPPHSHVTGIDISGTAVDLAKLNRARNFPKLENPRMSFLEADIFSDQFVKNNTHGRANSASDSEDVGYSILMANPPYISPAEFVRTTARSVRNFEPKLALVPPDPSSPQVQPGDTFYPRVLEIARAIRPRCMLLEVADMDQATRVTQMVEKMGQKWFGLEIWRDDPSSGESCGLSGTEWLIRGTGNGRSIFVHNFPTPSISKP
ncbi:S-adenosyl-L-methionine-dependent methyltransferase [Viridothelium virens]|uniref:S-adenosyl-L-methionine-dependent methyltransferase n=1 Tax=Viridothelium virens TaxID=1048519 RepID=A0A6A6H5U9_VIRVR|nr:S-adenosyl-L-methionine-dependent methyltransferase [Viridothelium virens]